MTPAGSPYFDRVGQIALMGRYSHMGPDMRDMWGVSAPAPASNALAAGRDRLGIRLIRDGLEAQPIRFIVAAFQL